MRRTIDHYFHCRTSQQWHPLRIQRADLFRIHSQFGNGVGHGLPFDQSWIDQCARIDSWASKILNEVS